MIQPLKQEDFGNFSECIFVLGDLHWTALLKLFFTSLKDTTTLFVFTDLPNNFFKKSIYFLLRKRNQIRIFSYQVFPIEFRANADAVAFKANDLNYENLIIHSRFPDAYLHEIYKSDEICIAFKKQLLLDIKTIKYFELVKRDMNEIGVRVKFEYSYHLLQLLNHSESTFPYARPKESSLYNNIAKILFLFKLLNLPLYLYLRSFFVKKQYSEKDRRDFLIQVFESDWGVSKSDLKPSVDWPITAGAVPGGRVLFVSESELSESYKNAIYQKEYLLEEVSKVNMTLKGLISLYVDFFKHADLVISDIKTSHVGFFDVVLKGYYVYLIWSFFLKSHSPRKFICYQGASFRSIFRNILLKKNGCLIFRYDHTFNMNYDIYTGGNLRGLPLADNSYTNYDYEFHWGKINALSSLNSKSISKKHFIIKPIWSYMLKSNDVKSVELILNSTIYEKNLSFINCFNSSYAVNSYSGNDEHFAFLDAIYRFICSEMAMEKNIVILFKSKFPLDKYFLSSSKKLIDIVKKLRKHDRFVEVPNDVAPTVMIDQGVLTVSMAYTSPSVEALMRGKKAIYFDYNCRYQGSFFREIDNFVAYTSADLEKLIEYSLNTDESIYLDNTSDFRSKYFWDSYKDLIDPVMVLKS